MRLDSTAWRRDFLCAATVAIACWLAPSAQAYRPLLDESAVNPATSSEIPEGQIEGACGVAVNGGTIYVSDYYHGAIDVFGPGSTIPVGAPSGPCGLATGPGGALYANVWHGSVVRVLPTPLSIDAGEATGVAVDQATGRIYVNARTHVAVYLPSGAPVLDGEGEPLRIGSGSIEDGYGLAVFAGKVYVPDAADSVIEVFEPALDPDQPVKVIDGAQTPQGGFSSLVDAAAAVDPTNGHLLVVDNLQPGFEHPVGAVDEFDASGQFLDQLSPTVVDGGPSGLAVVPGSLYVTSGNSEESTVLRFGAYSSSAPLAAPAEGGSGAAAGAAARAERPPSSPPAAGQETASASEVIQRGKVRVNVDGRLAPRVLPRHGAAPVRVSVAAKITTTDGGSPPQLRGIEIAINRHGRFDVKGLPLCAEREIQPATTANALRACRDALVGEGQFSANVQLSQQAPFPARGKVYAFNGRLHGRPAIFAHVYGVDPVPTSFTLPFELRPARGTYGTVMRADLPQATGDSGYITGLSLSLGRSFSFRGKRHSYLSAGCPAPQGFHRAVFPLARASLFFRGGSSLVSTLVRSCGVRG